MAHDHLTEAARTTLLAQEDALRYPARFGAAEALRLGSALARLARGYDRGVAATITREADGLALFSWAMDDKAPRNYGFCTGKRLAALRCGHASLMCYVEHELDGSWGGLFAAAERRKHATAATGGAAAHAEASPWDSGARLPCPTGTPADEAFPCPAGGAFPIRVGDDRVATLAVSGLHDGLDHELCVRALATDLDLSYGIDVPVYDYPAI